MPVRIQQVTHPLMKRYCRRQSVPPSSFLPFHQDDDWTALSDSTCLNSIICLFRNWLSNYQQSILKLSEKESRWDHLQEVYVYEVLDGWTGLHTASPPSRFRGIWMGTGWLAGWLTGWMVLVSIAGTQIVVDSWWQRYWFGQVNCHKSYGTRN